MGLADQNKRVHRGGGGGVGREKIYFFTNDYKLRLIFCLLKFYMKSKKKKGEEKNTLREVNKKLRFLGVCSFKSRQI